MLCSAVDFRVMFNKQHEFGGARGVMVILAGNDCISHSTNTLGKGMNPIILPPAMGK